MKKLIKLIILFIFTFNASGISYNLATNDYRLVTNHALRPMAAVLGERRAQEEVHLDVEEIARNIRGKRIRSKDNQVYELGIDVANLSSSGEQEAIVNIRKEGERTPCDYPFCFTVKDGDVIKVGVFPDRPTQGKWLTSQILEVFGDSLPEGAVVRSLIQNEETLRQLYNDYIVDKSGNILRKKDGFSVVVKDNEDLHAGEVSLESVFSETKIGRLFARAGLKIIICRKEYQEDPQLYLEEFRLMLLGAHDKRVPKFEAIFIKVSSPNDNNRQPIIKFGTKSSSAGSHATKSPKPGSGPVKELAVKSFVTDQTTI